MSNVTFPFVATGLSARSAAAQVGEGLGMRPWANSTAVCSADVMTGVVSTGAVLSVVDADATHTHNAAKAYTADTAAAARSGRGTAIAELPKTGAPPRGEPR